MSGVRVIYSRMVRQSLGADVNITAPTPYQTLITGYNDPISLAAQTRDGMVIEIVNSGTGSFILVDSDITLQGAATDQLRINNNMTAMLMYLAAQEDGTTERYRLIGGSDAGLTLQ